MTRLKRPRFLVSGFYLDPHYGCTLAHESEIFALLQELLLSERSQAIRDDILQLLGDYCGDFSVLRSRICEAPPELLPGIKRLIEG